MRAADPVSYIEMNSINSSSQNYTYLFSDKKSIKINFVLVHKEIATQDNTKIFMESPIMEKSKSKLF